MDEFLKELEKMNLTQINERIANWETEVRNANSKEELDGITQYRMSKSRNKISNSQIIKEGNK